MERNSGMQTQTKVVDSGSRNCLFTLHACMRRKGNRGRVEGMNEEIRGRQEVAHRA